ncbi:MAG: hypothetical protein BGO30_10465 [Bacteroidetes bacterium 41-46]|nr:MAG: hypothetical protein BGO30_10465 [Bacteroidetes bacterium 41-46]
MKISRFLSLIALGLLTLSLFSCNKEPQPIVLAGTWNIDTTQTMVLIKYDAVEAELNPVAYNFLRENIQKIRKNLIQPDQLVFDETNSVLFKMKSGQDFAGTYTKIDEVYFQITNLVFPDGILGGCDNTNLELYYPRDYILSVISGILTPQDPPIENFDRMITAESGGIMLFRR